MWRILPIRTNVLAYFFSCPFSAPLVISFLLVDEQQQPPDLLTDERFDYINFVRFTKQKETCTYEGQRSPSFSLLRPWSYRLQIGYVDNAVSCQYCMIQQHKRAESLQNQYTCITCEFIYESYLLAFVYDRVLSSGTILVRSLSYPIRPWYFLAV